MIQGMPEPPYYAVIFTSVRTPGDAEGYGAMADEMVRLAEQQPGFLGIESARQEIGITVSYWDSPEAIRAWKQQADHLQAQMLGRKQWYASYKLRVCRVERDYDFSSTSGGA